MNANKMIKTKTKDGLLSLILYVLAAILLIAAFISLAACQQNISAQLAQGVSVKGNELAILNIYLSSCVQHFAFAGLLFFCGLQCRKSTFEKMGTLKNILLPYAENQQCGIKSPIPSNMEHPDETELEIDFTGWNSKE